MRHERGDVHGLPFSEEGVEVLAEGRPVEVDAPVVVDADGDLFGQLLVGRGRRAVAAVADHRCGEALPDAALGEPVDVYGEVGVAVDVDEAGRDDPAGGVECPGAFDL